MLIFALAIQAGAKWQFIHFVVIRLDFIGFCAFRWELSVIRNTSLRFLGEQFKVTWKSLNFANFKLNSSLSYQQLKGQSTTTTEQQQQQRRQVTSATIVRLPQVVAQKQVQILLNCSKSRLQTKERAHVHSTIHSVVHSFIYSFVHPLIQLPT